MKKAKIVIADNEDGKGWFIYRVDHVTDNEEFIEGQSVGIEVGKPIEIGEFEEKQNSPSSTTEKA